jgi:hypothetical protein
MISKELLMAYQATCYSIINPKIDVYLNEENEEFNRFLKIHQFTSWCFITAWNPFSKALSLKENNALNAQLEADLKEHSIFPALGKDTIGDWPPEISFFVGNIAMEEAMILGNKYSQNAIVFGSLGQKAALITLEPIES